MSVPRRVSFSSGLGLGACLLLALACQPDREQASSSAQPSSDDTGAREAANRERTVAGDSAPTGSYGSPVSPGPATRLADILEAPSKYADQTVLVDGHVSRVCTKKGCWMELAEEGNDAGARCRVTFKDYAFFVPTNSAGSQAKVEGQVQVDRITPGRVRHLEAEGGTFDSKNPDGSASEVRLVATGVELSPG